MDEFYSGSLIWNEDEQRWDKREPGTTVVTTSLEDLLSQIQGVVVPAAHKHQMVDLPEAILGFAVGTATERPKGFEKVLWLAASEPPEMIDGDLLFLNAIFG